MQLPDNLPHVSLMEGVTPLQEMPRLREALMSDGRACPQLYIKRDDLTGLAGGGNKTRKLEYLIGDALQKGADTVITAGALQSNHARQTAAAAAKMGLAAHLILFETVPYEDPAYSTSGNLLLDRILGAEVHRQAKDADARAVFEEVTEKIRASGGTPYLIPVGGSNAVGSTAYAQVFLEIQDQAKAAGITVDRIFHANGSLGTQAGLLAGRALTNGGPKVEGISVSKPTRESLLGELLDIANLTSERIGGSLVQEEDVRVEFRHLGDGYGMPTEGMVSAVELVARTEGLLLDPVYTGKAMAGMIAAILNGEIGETETLVFLHTGGMPGLFAYPNEFKSK
ncbi:MAG: D-cysteine desulfhydrase family protein [Rhodobiaceae bacterium]|nr:D-cysteine desulfhydrase family protein [Rhodobiaceae bacterium]